MTNLVKLRVLNDVPCPHGLEREHTCDTIADDLKRNKIPPIKACSSCNLPDSIEMLSLINPKACKAVHAKLGFEAPSETKTICLLHKQEIRTNCELRECNFYTTYPKVKNCTLVYMNKLGLESLSVQDISILFSSSELKIQKKLDTALANLRQDSVEDSAIQDLDRKFVVLTDLPVCINCEKPSQETYCSPACQVAKPERVSQLEALCGTDIGTIIDWVKKRYHTQEAVEQVLGLNAKHEPV